MIEKSAEKKNTNDPYNNLINILKKDPLVRPLNEIKILQEQTKSIAFFLKYIEDG